MVIAPRQALDSGEHSDIFLTKSDNMKYEVKHVIQKIDTRSILSLSNE